jgi:hypothetical protein
MATPPFLYITTTNRMQHYMILLENLNGRNYLGDLHVGRDERAMLIWILQTQSVKV